MREGGREYTSRILESGNSGATLRGGRWHHLFDLYIDAMVEREEELIRLRGDGGMRG